MEATTIAAFVSTTAISLAPNALLFLFPNYSPSDKALINPLDIGQALAAGGLLGDVFLHTLPHEMNERNGELIGLAILAGFLVFLLFDILVRSYHSDDHDHGHSHGHSHDSNCNNKAGDSGKRPLMEKIEKKYILNSAAVLNLAADSLHNFTDGIAIGASFAGVHHDTSLPMVNQIQQLLKSRGGLASLAVLFHEIPHELGDYAILVSAGMSKKQAILAQFSTAIAAYCGTFVGLFGVQSVKDYVGSDIMVPFVAGGFVYLSTVTILSGLLEQRVQKKARVAQVLAFLMGIGFMYGVAMLEHQGGSCGHGHSHAHHDHGHIVHPHGSHNHIGHSHDHAHAHTQHHDHGHNHHHILPDVHDNHEVDEHHDHQTEEHDMHDHAHDHHHDDHHDHHESEHHDHQMEAHDMHGHAHDHHHDDDHENDEGKTRHDSHGHHHEHEHEHEHEHSHHEIHHKNEL